MRKLIFILITLIGFTTSAQVDMSSKFSRERKSYDEMNDCSVVAIASAFNKSYSKAHRELRDAGRKSGDAVTLRFFINHIRANYEPYVTSVGYFKETISQFKFKKEYARLGRTYIVMTKSHTFAIKYNNGKYVTYGNLGDEKERILYFIELSVTN